MPAEKVSDLLPLPNGCREPHAYQVFGLADGEQDPKTVTKAIQETVKRLKACKDETEPKIWKQAAKLVNDAKIVLGDPDQKAELDARFGIFAVPEPIVDHNSAAQTSDPLAAVLPAADPLASMLPSADPMAPAPSVRSPAQPVGTPAPSIGVAPTTGIPPTAPAVSNDLAPPAPAATLEPAIPSIAVEDPRASSGRTSSRRRRSSTGLFMFAGFMISMMGLIGVLVYFVFVMDGVISVSQRDGNLVSNQTAEGTVNGQAQTPPDKPRDPIMGDFAEEFTPGPDSGRPSGLVSEMDEPAPNANDMGMGQPSGNGMTPSPAMPATEPETGMDPEPVDPVPAMDTDAAMDDEPNMESESMEPDAAMEPETDPKPELTDEMIAEADSVLKKVEDLIRSAKWKEMLPAAEQLLETPMDKDQRARAEALHELADLATYYRGGIEKAVADLSVGNDFEVTKDFRVIVVEKGEDLLVVRFNERNKSFRFDEFSFPLAHKLASFAMPKSPGAEAAKAVYQAIAPRSNEGYIEQSLEMLEEIDPDTEEVDVARAIETLESLVCP
ncbi:MAG: hypothetical protein AAGG48_05580 [Planctomycetota bacterium]